MGMPGSAVFSGAYARRSDVLFAVESHTFRRNLNCVLELYVNEMFMCSSHSAQCQVTSLAFIPLDFAGSAHP